MKVQIDRLLKFIGGATITSLLLTSCTLPVADSKAMKVEADGALVTVSGVKVTIPGGAVPAGTAVNASFDEAAHPQLDSVTGVQVLAEAFQVTLGEGIQPELPLTVEIPIDRALLSPDAAPDETLALLIRSEGSDTPDLVPAQWNDAEGTITAEVPHLSWFWPIQIDLGTIMRSVQDTVLQGLGIEHAKPDCVGETANVGGTGYSVLSPAQTWICVKEENGSLVVEASPNSPIPFLASSDPLAQAQTSSEVSVATAFSIALAGSLHLSEKGESIMMPGTTARFIFDGEPESIVLRFEQYPVMLLVSILTTTLDTALSGWGKPPALDIVEDIGCMGSIFDTAGTPGDALSAETAAGITRSFFKCAGTLAEMTPAQQIILAMLSAGPQFLVASALGIINEVTGQGRFTATVDADDSQHPIATGSRTQFVTFDPWTDGSIGPETPVIDNSTVSSNGALKSCFSSSTSSRDDAYRCTSSGVYDPCFMSPDDPESFGCLVTGEGLSWQVLENMPTNNSNIGSDEPGEGPPIVVELSDGTICTRASGAGPAGVEGYPSWAGVCRGPRAGVWRTNEEAAQADEPAVRNLYGPTENGFWQIAISVGEETASAIRFDVAKVYN